MGTMKKKPDPKKPDPKKPDPKKPDARKTGVKKKEPAKTTGNPSGKAL
jgi:hypothetical protein